MRRRSKRISVNLLLALGALLSVMALGELGLRLWKPRQVMVQRQAAIYLRDEVLGSRYQPGASGLMHRCFEIDNVVNVFPAMERDPGRGWQGLRGDVLGPGRTFQRVRKPGVRPGGVRGTGTAAGLFRNRWWGIEPDRE